MITLIVTVLIALVVVGLIVWLEETYLPIAPEIKRFIRIAVIVIATICVGVFLMQQFGCWPPRDIPVPKM